MKPLKKKIFKFSLKILHRLSFTEVTFKYVTITKCTYEQLSSISIVKNLMVYTILLCIIVIKGMLKAIF